MDTGVAVSGFATILNVVMYVAAFVLGAAMVYRLTQRGAHGGGQVARAAQNRRPLPQQASRPASQIPIRGIQGLVEATGTAELLISIERKTRLSQANFQRDCQPVLEQLAEFVQMLPASESHHHAHPGGLWQHLLEVADAALTFRAGMELPPGASTEDRKRQEHRWSYAVLVAALLHDVGKPVTDVRVMLYTDHPRDGRPWAPLAGSMRSFGAHWYSVAFADPTERDYLAHAKLAAMLLHAFVPARVSRWLAEEGDVLSQLLAYLSGEDKDGALGALVKRADSDSVRKNLLQGPRTRFASARATPLIERLMEALRRMLHEGAALPLNRPGAAGWVHDGRVWFVCARLADEVRSYLSQHESLQGIPGKDKNDRLFDIWQEYGAAETAPDGGAVWRVRVECESWSPPDAFTVLCFKLETLYSDPASYPAAMKGRVWLAQPPTAGSSVGAGPAGVAQASQAARAAAPLVPVPTPPQAELPRTPVAPTPMAVPVGLAPELPGSAAVVPAVVPQPAPTPVSGSHSAQALAQVAAPAAATPPPDSAVPAQQASVPGADDATAEHGEGDDTLPAAESAGAEMQADKPTRTPELGAPLRPRERGQRPAGAVSASTGRVPSAAATAFMAWVAQSVGAGTLKYNEEGALVHFVPEGALLLSPEIFRRFLSEHDSVASGPIAELRQSHGDRAFARLQNELAKSGWTVRNGDENMHYYAFIKADKSLSRTASFCLVGKPELFWNPVPAPNERIAKAPKPRRMTLPAGAVTPAKPSHAPRSAT